MLNHKQIRSMLAKISRFEEMLGEMIFESIDSLSMSAYQTKDQLYTIPDKSLLVPIQSGDIWGGDEYTYCWMVGEYTVPEAYAGKPLYLRPNVGAYEALMWVDGQPSGIFTSKIIIQSHGNHYCDMITKNPKADQKIDLAIECYSGHYIKGSMPFTNAPRSDYKLKYESVDICIKNERVAECYFDLRTVVELMKVLPDTSFRKAEIIQVMMQLHEILYYSPENVSHDKFMKAVDEARTILAPVLAKANSLSAPTVGVIGHSHMDTAWHWHIDETIKKCARTFSNQLNLMEQYPEYRFIQSAAYHGEMMRKHYPELFERIQAKVKEGRYEPNGAVWVECDCNITSGESMIRQFLWGQRFTREHFSYTSNVFWLPDTFGYSAAIPQIMKGCEVEYFLTTKIAWNDTNMFPYDTFWWKGIDGTKVLSHFNKTHVWPSPKDMYSVMYNEQDPNVVKQRHVTDHKLIAYGYGDGGGGPQYEMLEIAKRCKDLDGCPKVEHLSVGEFMNQLEENVNQPSTYNGELYLELHRGTLTNQHEIKRNNRDAEIRMHNLEYLMVQNAVQKGEVASDKTYRTHQETVLVNQFHDILPGTSDPRIHDEAKAAMGEMLDETYKLLEEAAAYSSKVNEEALTLVNTTSFARKDAVYLPYKEGFRVQGDYKQQVITTLNGEQKLAVAGVEIAPYSSRVLHLEKGAVTDESVFIVNEHMAESPFAKVIFNQKGYIESFYDKAAAREVRGEGYALNTFLIGEDVPSAWDNWDIDADLQLKLKDEATLITREVIAEGEVELRIRSQYQLTEKSTITQDMIFYSDSPQVKFETLMDWQDDHRFLKVAFDTNVFNDFVRQEIQFGHVKRPTTRNHSIDEAKFEVLNHKFTDLSELSYGVVLLNDCKYGISVYEGQLRLSLHKGGCRPDYRGDKGQHYCEYVFLPHQGGFSASTVIKPSYELNYKHLMIEGERAMASLVTTNQQNIIIETIKACEDEEKAFILRLYEAEGNYTHTEIQIGQQPRQVQVTNMLEEVLEELEANEHFNLTFKPFEIKTVKISY